MKTARLFLPVATFAAAALVARFWPGAAGPAETGKTTTPVPVVPNFESTRIPSGKTTGRAGEQTASKESAAPETAPAAPTIEEVFAATGLDRMLLMARFIQTASGEELKAVIDRAEEDQIYETAFTDQVWLRWVEVDLEAALKHARSGNAWWAYAKLDPQAALFRCLESAKVMLPLVLRSIGQSDPILARKLLADHPEMDQELALDGIMEGLGKKDPAAATALALEKGGTYLDGPFNNWMRQDPEGALTWMRTLTKPADRRRVEDLAMAQLISTDPATGLKAVLKLPPGLGQTTRTVEAISALARQNPAAARAAADALPSPYARQKALAALAVSLASQGHTAVTVDLVSSLDWDILAKSRQSQWSYVTADGKGGGSGSSGEDASETILTQLMAAAPQVTADALASPLSGPNVRNESNHITERLGTAVQKWAAVQPEEASAWLKNYPPGAARDAGIEGLTTWLISGSPEPDFAAALAWAGAATHEQQQLRLYENTISSWRTKDPQAAAAALENLPLSSSQRDQLNQLLLISQPAPFAK